MGVEKYLTTFLFFKNPIFNPHDTNRLRRCFPHITCLNNSITCYNYLMDFNRKEYMRAYSRKQYQKLKKDGVCVNCHKEPAVTGKTCCKVCLEKKKLNQAGVMSNSNKDVYFEIFKSQEGKCKICKEPMTRPMLDHDHKTGEVRGLLCSSCNVGLGYFRDNSESLLRAADYVLNSRTGHMHKAAKRKIPDKGLPKPLTKETVRVLGISSSGLTLTD